MRARIITAGDLVDDGTGRGDEVENGVVIRFESERDLTRFIKRAAQHGIDDDNLDPADGPRWGFEVDVGRHLGTILTDVVEWQRTTFGEKPEPHGAAEHLRREAVEVWHHFWSTSFERTKLDGPIKVEAVAEECADVFFMLAQLSTSLGFDLADEVAKKLAKNKRRTWKQPDEHGVVEHASEGGES